MSSAGDFTCRGLKFTVPFWVPFLFANAEEKGPERDHDLGSVPQVPL